MTILQDIHNYDLRLLMWCQKSRYYPPFILFVRAISKTGDGYLQLLVPLIYWLIDPVNGGAFFQMIIVAFAIERSIYFILKNKLKRRRPPEVIPYFTSVVKAADKFSFPSGHTMAAFMLAYICCLSFDSSATVLYVWAFMVASSRVILGVHFPTDTIAGAILGTVIGYFVVV